MWGALRRASAAGGSGLCEGRGGREPGRSLPGWSETSCGGGRRLSPVGFRGGESLPGLRTQNRAVYPGSAAGGGGGLFLAGRSVRKCFGSVDGLKKFVLSLTCGEGVSEFSPACSSRGVV